MELFNAGKHTFTFGSSALERIILPHPGTSITIEYWSGGAWVQDPKSPVTEITTMYTVGFKARLTATGQFGFYSWGSLYEPA